MEQIADRARPVLVVAILSSVALCVFAILSDGVSSLFVTVAALALAGSTAALALVEHRSNAERDRVLDGDLLDVLNRELARCRRHEHALAVARLPIVDRGSVGTAGRYLAMVVAASLRTIDEVVVDGDSLYLVMPETDSAAARKALRRLHEAHPGVFGAIQHRVAVFPDDGVTVTALMALLTSNTRLADPAELPKIEQRRRITVDVRDSVGSRASDGDASR